MHLDSTEKFQQTPFDYTEWQKDLFKGMSIDEICDAAEPQPPQQK